MAEISSGSSATVPITNEQRDWFLTDPLDLAYHFKIDVTDYNITEAERAGVFEPIGRNNAVVVSDGKTSIRGTISCVGIGAAEHARMREVLTTSRILLLRSPYGDNYYIRVNGDRTTKLVLSGVETPFRVYGFSFIQVDKPVIA